MNELDAKRRDLERERMGEPETYVCPRHGEHSYQVCLKCYGEQQERVERESAPLREENTTENLRARVLSVMASSNGRKEEHGEA